MFQVPEWHKRAQVANAPFEINRKLQEGSGNWPGDPALFLWFDPQGKAFYVMQHTPHGVVEVYASSPGESLDERIFEHLARNHWSRVLAEAEKARKITEQQKESQLNTQVEAVEDALHKADFYSRQVGITEG